MSDLNNPKMPITDVNFFQLLRQLEKGDQVFGRSGGPKREPARLGQHVRQSFAVQDVASMQEATPNSAAKVKVMNLGLLGPEGPMPLHMTRWVLDRLSQRWFSGSDGGETSDTTFVDFADMLQHREIALFYRAWAESRPDVQSGRAGGDRFGSLFRALAGVGLPGTEGTHNFATVRTQQAAGLGQQVRGPERLTKFVSAVIGAPVQLVENVGNWVEIPKALQTRLGKMHCGLATSSVAGSRSFQRQNKAELRVGPLDFRRFAKFAAKGQAMHQLRAAILAIAGHEIDVDVRLMLRKEEIPAAAIGKTQLSRTAWLQPKRLSDAGDVCISHAATLLPLEVKAVA